MKRVRNVFVSAAVVGAVFGTLLMLTVPAAHAGPKDIEAQLACQCGCGLTVLTCNHLQCGFAVPVREKIAASLTEGVSESEILEKFVEEYGEKVLSSPTHTGFNLLAWYMPYLAVLVGGALVFFVMRKWRKPTGELADPATSAPAAQHTSADRETLERELEEFDS